MCGELHTGCALVAKLPFNHLWLGSSISETQFQMDKFKTADAPRKGCGLQWRVWAGINRTNTNEQKNTMSLKMTSTGEPDNSRRKTRRLVPTRLSSRASAARASTAESWFHRCFAWTNTLQVPQRVTETTLMTTFAFSSEESRRQGSHTVQKRFVWNHTMIFETFGRETRNPFSWGENPFLSQCEHTRQVLWLQSRRIEALHSCPVSTWDKPHGGW